MNNGPVSDNAWGNYMQDEAGWEPWNEPVHQSEQQEELVMPAQDHNSMVLNPSLDSN